MRTRTKEPPADLHVMIPAKLMRRVDAHLTDPITGKPAYGSRARIVAQALEAWCREFESAHAALTGETNTQPEANDDDYAGSESGDYR